MKKFLVSVLTSVTLIFLPTQTFAGDVGMAAIGGLVSVAAYNATLKSILEIGNSARAQVDSRKQDLDENGEDQDPADRELIDRVMNRLINDGKYSMRVNSLPFIWAVNDSEFFNASCYPTDYISVNRGLVIGFNRNEDEIAAVLAHEMTHGLEQHSAKNYAMAVAQYLGAGFLTMSTDAYIDWNRMSGMVNYSVAKNVTLPSEYEADELGFYIAASAGFNPGGPAAAMVKMDHYFKYETTNFLEFDPGENLSTYDKRHVNPRDMSDHPETEKREEKLAELLTKYSGGRVSVKKIDSRVYKMYVDGIERESFRDTKDLLAGERAYLTAGELARKYHDEIGLTDEEKSLDEKWSTVRENFMNADQKYIQAIRMNADAYVDLKLPSLALTQIKRAELFSNEDNPAEFLSIRGRIFAANNDFDSAFRDSNKSIELDPNNFANYLNRADVYKMHGDFDSAVADAEKSIELEPQKPFAYKFLGELYDQNGNRDLARKNFEQCYKITKQPRSIPLEYLKEIDPKAAKTIEKDDKKSEKKDGKK